MSGNYEINPSGGGDFTSINAAAAALNSQGMSGNVTLRLANGLYEEQAWFEIPDQTESQMLTIESMSGDEADVVISYVDAGEETNYQLAFSGIQALTIRNISINTSEADHGLGILLHSLCRNITIDNISHHGNRDDPAIQGGITDDFFVPSEPIHHLTVTNSHFHRCSAGVQSGNAFLSYPDENPSDYTITNNVFFDANGLELNHVDGVVIEDNLAYGEQFNVIGFAITNCTDMRLQRNIVYKSMETVRITNCVGTEDNPILIANNFFSGFNEIVSLSTNEHLLFAHNSVYGDDQNPVLSVFMNQDSRIVNNIFFQNHTEGIVTYIFPDSPESYLALIDFNCFYSNGFYTYVFTDTGISYLNYDEFVELTGWEADGISIHPDFAEPGVDLHVQNQLLNQGTPLDEIPTDIDGELRNQTNPTIGADEMDGVAITADLTIDTVITSGDPVGGEPLTVQWSGANNGNTDFSAPWIDRIFLSDDAVLDESDQELYEYEVQVGVPAFGTYQRQQIITLDLALQGTKYIIVKIDAEAQLIEDNANNTAVSAPFTVTAPSLPNLVVTAIEMPDNVFSGTQLQVDFTVTNTGTAPAVGEWKDFLWYETQLENFAAANYPIANDPVALGDNVVGLMPGDSYQGSVIFETPYIGQGYAYVRVQTDGYDQVVEEVDGNDNFSDAMVDSVFVNQSPLADLIVEDIQVPAESFAGEEVTISYTVRNVGTETTSPTELPHDFYYGWLWGVFSGDWVDYIYFSDTTLSFGPSDYKRVFSRAGNLEVDDTYIVSMTITLPECTEGEFVFTIYADRWNHVAELNEENNALVSSPITIIPRPAPDLVPTAEVPLSGWESNTTATLSYQVENLGADTAFGVWRDRIFVSYSDTFMFDISEMTADTFRNVDMAPDDVLDFEIQFEIPHEIYGDAYVYLWVDAVNDACEYPNDDNNIVRFPVSVAQSPAPDLEVEFTAPGALLTAGDDLDMNVHVSNNGEVPTEVDTWRDRIYLRSETSDEILHFEDIFRSGILPAGATYLLSAPFRIPLDIPPGFYTLGIYTDGDEEVWENGMEENNHKVTDVFQIVHDSTRAPDRLPISLLPQNWKAGENFEVEINVKNQGAAIDMATWVDELVLVDALGNEWNSATSIFSGELPANASYTAVFEMEFPVGLPENAVLIAEVDTSDEVFEYFGENNTREFALQVETGPAPDFSPTDLEVPVHVHAGQEITLSVLRNNFGDAAVTNRNWVERVLLSSDDFPDEDDYTLRSYIYMAEAFDANFTDNFTDSIAIPLNRVGEYYVIFVMDADDQIAEGTNEMNNHVVSTQTLLVDLPPPVDFATEFVDIDIVDGNPERMEYSVQNTSTNNFVGKFYNTWFLSEDDVYSLDDKLLGLDIVADYDNFGGKIVLGPGETAGQFSNFIYVPVVAGEYYIIQKIDAFLNVYESDETNNTRVFGPFEIDNVPEIFPGVTYERQFGRNSYQSEDNDLSFSHYGWNISVSSLSYDSGYDPTPDRHDYKIQIPNGFGMIAHMWEDEEENEQYGMGNESQPVYEMYVGEGFVPTPLEHDFRHDSPMQSEQHVIVPVGAERMDYIKTQAPYIPPHFHPAFVPVSNYFLRAELKSFSVYDLHPEWVGTSHNTTLRISGFDLADSAGLDVALIQGMDTVYAFETYPQNPSELVAYIDMRNSPPGMYELMVRKRSSGDYTVWEEPVEVREDEAAVLFAEVNAPTSSRSDEDFTITVSYGNHGYSNFYDMILILAVFMEDSGSTGLDVDFLGSTFPGYDGTGFISTEYNAAEPILLGVFDDAVYYGAYVPIVHARSRESFHFEINGSLPGTVVFQASLGVLNRSPYTFTGRVEDAGTSYYVTMLANAIGGATGVLADFAKRDCGQILNADAMTQRLAEQTYAVAEKARGASGFKDDVKKNINEFIDHDSNIKQRYDAFKGLIDQKKELDLTANEDTPFYTELTDMFDCINDDSESDYVDMSYTDNKCEQIATWSQGGTTYRVKVNMRREGSHVCPLPQPQPPRITHHNPKDRKKTENTNSKDPNEIVGPRGTGPARLVEGSETFEYTVYFENTPESTAPAARVRIDNPLDSNLRTVSFRVISFGFADTAFHFNASPFVQETFPLGSAFQNQSLRFIAGTNPTTNKAFFELITINPETQGIVTGAYDGFLWPNDSTGRGQGFVTYQIEAVRDLSPGTRIQNKAAIIFDNNEIIETNTWSNTIAGGELASAVRDLPLYSPESFEVKWENLTPPFGPPVEAFDVYYREVGGEKGWTKWLDDAKQFGKKFQGKPGSSYEFYSRARSGELYESVDESPQAKTTVLDFRGGLGNGEIRVFPNPSIGPATLVYRSPGAGSTLTVSLNDVSGRTISSEQFTASGDGVQFFSLPLTSVSAGMYVVSLHHGDNLLGSCRLVTTGDRKD